MRKNILSLVRNLNTSVGIENILLGLLLSIISLLIVFIADNLLVDFLFFLLMGLSGIFYGFIKNSVQAIFNGFWIAFFYAIIEFPVLLLQVNNFNIALQNIPTYILTIIFLSLVYGFIGVVFISIGCTFRGDHFFQGVQSNTTHSIDHLNYPYRLVAKVLPAKYREEYLGDLIEYHNYLKTQDFSKSKARIYLLVQLAPIISASIWQRIVELFSWNKEVGR